MMMMMMMMKMIIIIIIIITIITVLQLGSRLDRSNLAYLHLLRFLDKSGFTG